MRFFIASEKEIKCGETTDIYFQRTKQILDKKGINKKVTVEVTLQDKNFEWGVFAGLEEVCYLLEGLPVDVYAMPEGTIFNRQEPVLQIIGPYKEFCVYETAILGIICQASGIATKAAKCKLAAGFKPVFSFGIRRMHPVLAPMIDRYAYIGGLDGVSGVAGAKLLGISATGTMPHALILVFGDQVKAWRAFDEIIEKDVPRIALVDTLYDEKTEALLAAENIKSLSGVRLDTPSSRRGNFKDIIKEVRWELDIRGYKHIKIFVSGGLNEDIIKELRDIVDAFGVGTSVSSATLDFAMDIVEVDGVPFAKRGKLGGRKSVYVCENCNERYIKIEKLEKCPKCNNKVKNLLIPVIKEGKVIYSFPEPSGIREFVLSQLRRFADNV